MASRADRTDPDALSPAERYRRFRERTAQGPQLQAFRDSLDLELDEFQIDACAALERGQGVLVAAPTGAGKTIVGEFAVHLAVTTGRKAFYTTPIKALSNQKYTDLVRRYGADSVGLLTGDTTINGEAPIVVMTTEVLRNMLYADSPTLDGLGYVVMDEVHYLADRFRGAVWEEVIIHLAPDVQLVSLSATVSNAEEFGDWLEMVRGDTAVVVSEHRPVPLSQHVVVAGRGTHAGGILDLYAHTVDPTAPGTNPPINPDLLAVMRQSDSFRGSGGSGGGGRGGYGGRGRGRGGRGGFGASAGTAPGASQHSGRRGPPRFAVVDSLNRAGLLPAIYFIFSRAGCEGAVAQCLGAGLRLTTPAQEAQIREIVEERCAAIPSEDLAILKYWGWLDALTKGIAAHHAGMLPLFKETVEELFSAGLVKVVFATETLALGINMPARSVVLEKLVKWDGSSHVDLTPGEYTQLTGRAGRRGIDVEGHAVVVDHPGLDPVALAGLASKRLYPLRSSFAPTYNMAVNLVSQVGRERAREILETSFAQFQADRGVVGLAKQASANSEALDGYAQAMHCDKGDFAEHMRLRRAITAREGDLARRASGDRRSAIIASLISLTRGDVIEIPSGRRAGFAIVLDPGHDTGFDGPRPTVLSSERQVKKLTLADVPHEVQVVGAVRIPKAFNPRNPASRRDLAAQLRGALAAHGGGDGLDPAGAAASGKGAGKGGRGVRHSAGQDAELSRLMTALRAHPCHSCPDREDHARWANRWNKLDAEHRALMRRIEGRTGSIAKVFDRICEVLSTLGYLERSSEGELVVTGPGASLRRLYAESDLLLAECLRLGTWEGLDAAALAAAVSTVVYSARRDDGDGEPRVPGGPSGTLARALDETVRVWSRLDDLEAAHRLESTGALDFGLVEAVHRWASGRSLDVVLKDTDLAAGDFVRWCKQIIDVLGQLTKAAPDQRMRGTADQAIEALRRGVVAYSSV